MINLLLDAKANINCLDKRGQTPLAICVENSDLNTATCLLRHGAEVNTVNNYGDTPLICAVTKQDEKLVDILVVHKADVNYTNHIKSTALIYAVGNVNKNIVSKLIQAGADVNIKTTEGYQNGYRIESDLLEEAKVTLLGSSEQSPTHLHIATQTFPNHQAQKSVELVNALLKGRAKAHAAVKHVRTPLHIAAIYGDMDIVKSLCQAGSNINVTDIFGNTPLLMSLLYKHKDVSKYLIESGADVNLMSESQCSPLHVAVFYNNTELVQMLIQKGALLDKGRKSELLMALNHRYINVSILLLENGANANVKDDTQTPALIIGLKPVKFNKTSQTRDRGFQRNQQYLFSNRRKIVYCLDPDENIKTKTLIESMLQHGANVSLTDVEGNTCLHEAARHCSKEILEFLLFHKAEINHQNVNGKTPLMIACVSGNFEAAEVLLKAGANVFLVDKNKNTALHHCAQNGMELLPLVEKLVLHSNKNNDDLMQENFFVSNANLIVNMRDDNAAVKGAENYMQDRTRKTALHFKSKSSNYSIISALLELGSNLDITTNEGITALMIAVNKGHLPFVKILVDNGACVNIRDCEGRNACMHALMGVTSTVDSCLRADGYFYYNQRHIIRNYLPVFRETDDLFEIINVLVTAGADLNILDNENRSLIVYTLLNVKRNSQEECIQRFLRLGFNLILHENHRYLLNKYMLTHGRAHYEKISLHDVLENNSKCIFQILLINGITLCHSVSNYTLCHYSNFRCALRYRNYDLLRFLLATGHVYSSDLKSLRYDSYFEDNANHYLNFNDSLHAELALAKREPWPLVKLAFIEVSTLLGTGPMREEKLKQTKLPPRLQRTLMFQEPISRLPVKDWSKIPLCFDPVEYETLPCPRPLLYYWPVGHRLVN